MNKIHLLPKVKHGEKKTNFWNQSELKRMQFASEVDGSMQICQVTANRAFMSRNMQKGQSYNIPAL